MSLQLVGGFRCLKLHSLSSPELEWYLEKKYNKESKIWKNNIKYNFIPLII